VKHHRRRRRPRRRSSLAACGALAAEQPQTPPLPREFRAAWVATVNNIDWPSEPGLPTRTQRDEITAHRRRLRAPRGSTRSCCRSAPPSDAFYRSRLEPWSAFLTGPAGTAPPSRATTRSAIWLDAAHGAGIDLHAWVNPFRVRHPKSIGRDAPTHLANKRPDLVRKHGPYLWLDPGAPDARDEALRVTDDLLTRYPVDGVHMDDYFYPYPRDNSPFPDAGTFRTHRDAHGRGLSLQDWRRANINAFIRDTAELVHTRRPGAIFTVSPFGIWRPEHPPGVKGFDAFEGLHADSRRWLREGWIDALMPQLYWPIESQGQPFEPLLDWWRAQNGRDRHLWPGLYLTRIKPAGSPDRSWAPDQIVRQIETIRRAPDATGFALFSAVGITDNRRGVADRLGTLNHAPAFVPPSPWATPRAPARASAARSGAALRLTPGRGGGPVRRWGIQYRSRDAWRTLSLPGTDRRVGLPVGTTSLRVVPVGSNGATGPTTTVA
jgi:uncharacterized lipoprotein YddW (UPF0748 family)